MKLRTKNKKNKIIGTIIMLILVLTLLIALLFQNNNQKNINGDDEKYCKSDSDCVKVKAGCCGCTAGGKVDVVNKESVTAWNLQLNENCANMGVCLTVISDDWTCFAELKCVNNKCELVRKLE